MKKSRSSKIVNLSPLVDVFMIVIFWYIMSSHQMLENNQSIAEDKIASITKELQDVTTQSAKAIEQYEENLKELNMCKERNKGLEEENDMLREQLKESQEEMDTLSGLLEKDSQYLLVRLCGGTEESRFAEISYDNLVIERLIFSDKDEAYLFEQFDRCIREYTDEDTKLIVMLIYEGNNTLYKDIRMITTALDEVQKKTGFVLTKIDLAR